MQEAVLGHQAQGPALPRAALVPFSLRTDSPLVNWCVFNMCSI